MTTLNYSSLILKRIFTSLVFGIGASVSSAAVAQDIAPLRTNNVICVPMKYVREKLLTVLKHQDTSSEKMRLDVGRLCERLAQSNAVLCLSESDQLISAVIKYQQTDKNAGRVKPELLLIALGDYCSITNAIKTLSSESPIEAFNNLRMSAQPRIIIALETLLFKEENWYFRRIGEDIQVDPPSFQAAHIILETIRSSKQFPPSLVDWATKTANADNKQCRALVRKWLTLNKRMLEEGRYSECAK